jgi:hypothetical protein
MVNLYNPSAARRADVQLRNNGGLRVLLRMPAPAATGDDAEQLGLATPAFQDIPLAPAAFHKATNATRLLVSASAVQTLLGSGAYDSADVLFATAAGVVIDDVLYQITNSFCSHALGAPYCYRLELQPPTL